MDGKYNYNVGLARHLGMRLVEVSPQRVVGRRTHVRETRVTDEAGKLLSLTIQTQIVVDAKP